MSAPRHGLLRDFLAILIIAVACPAAVFGGSMVGCIVGGFSAKCALNAAFISPFLLGGAGALAGTSTRGWTGLLLVYVGGVIGMTSILVLSYAVGRPVLVDPVSGVIATFWFMTPVSIGYAIGRVAAHRREHRSRAGSAGTRGARTA